MRNSRPLRVVPRPEHDSSEHDSQESQVADKNGIPHRMAQSQSQQSQKYTGGNTGGNNTGEHTHVNESATDTSNYDDKGLIDAGKELVEKIESALFVTLRRRLPITTKYVQDLWRERTILLFFGLLLFIALSVSLLLLTLSFIYNPDALLAQPLSIGIVGSSPVYASLLTHPKINLYQYYNLSDALADFDNSSLAAVFSTHDENGVTVVDAILPSSPVTSAVVLSISKDVFDDAEERLERLRIIDPQFVWPYQITGSGGRSNGAGSSSSSRGADTLFALILGLIIPLFVLIPAFVIGNMFVDTLTQEFEQKLHQSLFCAISPLRYVAEYLVFGAVANIFVVFVFVGILFLRFSFVEHFGLVLLYAFVFGILLFLFAMNCSFFFRRKEVAQTVYSFGVVALFLLSPFFTLSPIFTLTELLLGNTGLFFISLGILAVGCLLLFGLLYYRLKKEYYLS